MTIALEYWHDIGLARTVAMKALLHDIEESLTGDLVRRMKYFDTEVREDIRRVESIFARELFGSLDNEYVESTYLDIWGDAKDNELSGQIVALADLLCVIAYCDQESSLGNLDLRQIRHDCKELIYDKFRDQPEFIAIYKEALQ
jgi:5'-deoxynucleotidase YfbR-like HD superfamily hydrolase